MHPGTELLLRIQALVTTPLVLILAVGGLRRPAPPTDFEEINVQRINIVEPDGQLRMVLANRARSIGPMFKGQPFGYPGGTRPGIIFFNDEGTENGGLIFNGKTEDGRFRALGHLSFDQYNQDQVLYLQYVDENGRRRMGLTVADRADVSILDDVNRREEINRMPEGPARQRALEELRGPVNGVPRFAPRVYVGRDVNKAAVVNLSDRLGRPRLRLLVDSLNVARIEFLDEAGRVVHRLPEAHPPGT